MSPPPFVTPAAAVQTYVEAVAARDEDAARMAATKAGWADPPAEGPGAVFGRLMGDNLGLVHQHGQGAEVGDRAIEVCVATENGQPAFPLFMLMERHMGSWRVAGVNPVPGYAKAFLQGKAKALFDPRDLGPCPAIVPFADSLVAWLEGEALPDDAEVWLQEMISEWRAFVKPHPGSTFVQRTLDLPEFDRAAAMFVTESKTGARNVRWLVARRDGASWVPVWFGIDFSIHALLAKLD